MTQTEKDINYKQNLIFIKLNLLKRVSQSQQLPQPRAMQFNFNPGVVLFSVKKGV
jgi:hypothetical protein